MYLTIALLRIDDSLLPIDLVDLGLLEPDEVMGALVGDLDGAPVDPILHPVTGASGSLPTNLSGGLKARGHPVGGTGLFQIVEICLQMLGRFPNPRAQVANARVGLAHSIGGPGNNVYVTLIERSDNRRERASVEAPPRGEESVLLVDSKGRAHPFTLDLFYREASHVVNVHPGEDFAQNESYTLTVEAGVPAFDGTVSEEAFSFTFHTSPPPPPPTHRC